jgi:hypothetical protein
VQKTINHTNMKMAFSYSIGLFLTILVLTLPGPALAQDEEKKVDDNGLKPVKSTFDGTWLIDNQSVMVPAKGTLEFMIQHRFGTVSNGISDLFGLYAPSNIRLGLNYTVFDKIGFGIFKGPLSIGIGTTKNNFIQDVNVKYSLMQQTRNGKIPVSITYYGNVAMETARATAKLPNGNSSDRFSYFNQIIIARQFSSKLSLQVAPSITHFNVVEKEMFNDHYAVAAAARFKFSSQSSVMINVDQPITIHKLYNPQPNVSVGLEVSTSAHSFQVFATCYGSIMPQYNNMFNQNDPWGRGFLLGFNINRLWSF